MTRSVGTISSFSPTRIAGTVCFPHNPAHRPVLHLCNGWRLVGSRMAGERLQQLDQDWYVRDFEFRNDDMNVPRFSRETVSIIVAETGERLIQPDEGSGEMTVEQILQRGSQPPRRPLRTFEDALLYGYCGQEILELMFRDYLGRSCDDAAMTDWVGHLQSRATIVDLVQTLIQSPEYTARQLSLASLPGGMFANPLLYMADRERMKELQRATYAAPLHDLVVGLSALAGQADDVFVDRLFKTLLMRSVDNESRDYLLYCLANGWSQANIAAGIVASPEFNHQLLVGGFDALAGAEAYAAIETM